MPILMLMTLHQNYPTHSLASSFLNADDHSLVVPLCLQWISKVHLELSELHRRCTSVIIFGFVKQSRSLDNVIIPHSSRMRRRFWRRLHAVSSEFQKILQGWLWDSLTSNLLERLHFMMIATCSANATSCWCDTKCSTMSMATDECFLYEWDTSRTLFKSNVWLTAPPKIKFQDNFWYVIVTLWHPTRIIQKKCCSVIVLGQMVLAEHFTRD